MRIAFFGSSRFSCLVLRHILAASRLELACVVTQPDQPAGRSMLPTPTPVCLDAQATQLEVLKPQRLRGNDDIVGQLKQMKLDALLVASYGQIVPKRILELTPWPLNVHPSLLPKLRGASPIRSALLQGLDVTGCCIMRMTPRLDDGDVLLHERADIAPDWNYEQLETDLGELGGRLAVLALYGCMNGTARPQPQEHAQATYCGTYSREDTWIDWTRSARELHNFVRAWDPDVGALTMLDGRRLKVWRAQLSDADPGRTPGEVIFADRRRLTVACGSGALDLLELQPENKRRMSVADFMAGNRIEPGMRFEPGAKLLK